jgi:RNA 3'-terminal phosphate cyclase
LLVLSLFSREETIVNFEGITNDNIDLSVDLIKNTLLPFLESILGQKDLIKINIK